MGTVVILLIVNIFIEPSNDYEGQHSLDRAPWTGLETEDPVGSSWMEILLIQTFGFRSLSKFYPITIQRSVSTNLCITFHCNLKIELQ